MNLTVVLLALLGASCRSQDGGGGPTAAPLPASGDAAAIVAALKARAGSPLASGVAEKFDTASGRLKPLFPAAAAPKTGLARVTLPADAAAPLHLEDAASGTAIDVTLKDARAAAAQTADGYVVYARGHASGATVVHRALPTGTEDFLAFDAKPAATEIAYDLALGQGASGLRLVAGTLEVIDAGGAPRLRVTPPYIVGANGARTDAALAVDGCAVDTNAAGPWGRAVTAPGAKHCTVRVSWPGSGVAYPAVLDPTWATTGNMVVARQEHTATLLTSNNKVLVAGGRDGTGTAGLATAELYDPASGTWSATGAMTGARRLHSATLLTSSPNPSLGGKVLIAGGIHNTTTTTSAQLYNPSNGTWAAAGTLNAARHGHTATLLADGRVLTVGGLNGTVTLQSAAIFSPGTSGVGTWIVTNGPVPPGGQKFHTATLIQTTNTQLNNKVLLVAGNSGTASMTAVYLFDPGAASAFSTLQSIPGGPREQHTAVTLPNTNGKILVTGGKNGSTTVATAILFDPGFGPGSWSVVGSMTSPRVGHSMTVLPAGVLTEPNATVLVAGGSNGTAAQSSAEVFKGNTNTWVATTAMPSPSQGHTATLLTNKMVLLAGGVSGSTVLNGARFHDCSGGLACTSNGQCASGFCVSGVCCNSACGGACNSCTLPNFVGTCKPLANGTACSDGNACTQTDSCQSGACVGGNPVTCTAQDQCHTAGTCAPGTGVCSNPAKANGTACNDSNACTQTDTCQTGTCTGSNPITCMASDQCHTAGTCAPGTGVCSNPAKANGTACNDSNACTQTDACQAGTCTGSNPITCTASDQCHDVGTCSPTTGTCSNPAKANGTSCSDGNACTQLDICQAGTCTGSNPVTCTASDQCHDVGTCSPTTGTCSNPAKANGTSCSDGNACTQTDTCQAGTCSGGNPVTCVAQDQCHNAGTCSPTTGTCSNPAKPNGTSCSDSNACTQTDTCQSGTCTGSNAVTCVAQDQCHDVGTCSPSTGVCSNPEKANGTSCSDSNACTQTDTCQAGACSGGNPITCVAQDQCHDVGTCSPSTGACSNPEKANGTSCTDGNACTQTDTCQAGACSGGNPVTCLAQDQCHDAGACNPSTGTCSNPEKANGATCSDGDSCTTGETCMSGTCTGGTGNCGPIVVTQEIIYNRSIPQLAATLLADRTQAAGGDAVAFTSTVSNAGTMLDTQWRISVENVSTETFVVSGWQLRYEYQAVPSGQWTPFARVTFDAGGNFVPETELVPINFSFISPFVTGQTIAPGATMLWGAEIIPVMPPDVLGVVFDPAQSSGIRLVSSFDVPSSAPRSGATPLAYPGQDLNIENVTANLYFQFLQMTGQVPVSGALTPSGSGPLAPGESRVYSGTFAAPIMPAFPAYPGETEADYRFFLQSATANGYQPQVQALGQSTQFNPPGVTTFGSLPFELPQFLNMQKTGPATVNAGVATTYTLTLPNGGSGTASALTITDAIDGQPVTIGNLSAPATIAAGATGAATFTAASALDRSPGPMTDVATLTWQDRNGNGFGPISASFTNATAAGHPEGYLSLTTAAADIPHLVGDTMVLTVTALDPFGAPAPGVTVHFTATGPHAQSTDILTGADGKAVLSYTGTTIGVDRVVASATVTTTVVTTNVVNIQWATAVGTPCTGRATPLDVMLVIDVSGSMVLENANVFVGSTGKLEAVKVAATRFMDNLTPTRDQVGLVAYRAGIDQFVSLTSDPENVKPHLASAIEGGIFCATNLCDPGAAGSRIDVGLNRALDELESPHHRADAQKVIVYIGDGGADFEFMPAVARLQASGTRAIVLGIGSVVDGTVARAVASSLDDYFYSPSGLGVDYAFNNLNQDLCRNRAPFVSAGGDQGLYNVRIPSFLPLQGEVHDDRAGADARLTSEWSVVSGPGVVTFADASAPLTDALFSEPGTYVLQLEATDGYMTVADRATIIVDPDPSIVGANLAVTLSAPGPLETGQSETLTATLTDGAALPIRNYVVRVTVAGANPVTTTLTTNALGVAKFTYQGAKAGMDVLHATALGSTLQLESAFLSVDWVQPASGGAYLTQGWIAAPLDQAKLMERVDVKLSPDVTLANGTVRYYATATPAETHILAPNVSGAPGATIASFDTTLVSNGSYVLELDGTDPAGNQKKSVVLVTVTGEYKPGRVILELTDFEFPIAGLPIKIGRRYDSLDKDKVGDFGYGWSLTIGHPRLEVNPNFGVSLTLPNGRRATFDLALDVVRDDLNNAPSFFGIYSPFYRAEPGVFGTLTQEGACPYVRYNPSNPSNPLPCFFTAGFIPGYAPEFFTYTDAYGTAYRMTASGELKSIKDRQGNTLSFEPNGIISSAGQSVTFERDAQDRITKVLPPRFFGPGTGAIEYIYAYDPSGDLTSLQLPPTIGPPGQEMVRHTYDGAHRLLTTVDPRGNPARTSTYDPVTGRLATDKDALNNVTSYTYNLETRTNTTTFPDTGVVTETFDARGLLVSETNQLGHTTTHEYDANRNETKRTNAVGEVTTAIYDARGNKTSATDPTGTTRTTYDEGNLPVTFTDRLGQVTTIEYDDRHMPKRLADDLGNRFKFSNSEQGLPVSVEDAAGKRAYLEYDAGGNVTGRIDWLGRVTRSRYDDVGHLTHETSARGATKVHQVNQRGKVVFTQDHDGTRHHIGRDANDNVTSDLVSDNGFTDQRQTNYTYNALNQVTQITHHFAGTSVSYTRDFRGNPVTTTDEAGRVTTYEYDLAGQLTKTTFADGTFTTRTYDHLGRLESATDERDNTTTYAYEPGCGCSDRVTAVTDPLGTTTTTYDANGRRSFVIDASGRTTRYVYDVRDHVIETHYPDGTVMYEGYDLRGRRVSMTDQTGASTLYAYDDQGQLTSVTDPLNNVTRYAYDLDGNLISVTDANNHTTAYEYDLFNRKTKRTLPLGQFETFTYDPVGNTKTHTDFRGKTTTMTWDRRDRMLTKVPDPSLGEPTHVYTYSATGKRLTATDASGVTTYEYVDPRDRLTKKITSAGTLTYTYDFAGNIKTIKSLNTNGSDVSYVWNAANRLESVTDNKLGSTMPATTTATYTPTGRPSTLTQPNGVHVTYAYDDPVDRVTSMLWQHGGSPAFGRWSYLHNERGQRTRSTDITGRSAAYGYDAASRLTSETITGGATNGALSYGIDGGGNRLSRTSTLAGISASTYSYNANDELASDNYDANGNTSASGGHTFAFDFENHLVSKDGSAVTIAYDCDGNRVAKTVGGVTTRYLVDDLNPTGYGQVVEEVVGGAVQTRYTYGTSVVSQTRNVSTAPATNYYGYDARGDITFLTDASGAVTDSYDYDAWGILVARTGSTPNTRLYVGEEFDPDLGLTNLRARQYRSETGRFLTLDPLDTLGVSARDRNLRDRVGSVTNYHLRAVLDVVVHNRPALSDRVLTPVTLNRYLYGNGDAANQFDPSGKGPFLEALGNLRMATAVAAAVSVAFIAGVAYSAAGTGDGIVKHAAGERLKQALMLAALQVVPLSPFAVGGLLQCMFQYASRLEVVPRDEMSLTDPAIKACAYDFQFPWE